MQIKISKSQWLEMGKVAGWFKKTADDYTLGPTDDYSQTSQPTSTPAPTPAKPKVKPAPSPFHIPKGEEIEEAITKEDILPYVQVTFESFVSPRSGKTLKQLVLRNTAPEIAKDLKALGFEGSSFGEFKWAMWESDARANRAKIEAYGLDCSALDRPAVMQPKYVKPVPMPASAENEAEEADVPPEAKLWKKEMEDVKKLGFKERKDRYFDIIDNVLKKLSERIGTPEVLAQRAEIAKMMDEAQAKFHNYSPRNAMMIQIMRPHAEYAASEKNWRRMGRVPKKDAVRVPVLTPIGGGKNLTEEQKQTMTPQELRWASRVFFTVGTTLVYDDTEPIPGWVDKKTGKGPFEPPEWMINSNEATEWLTDLYAAAYKWGTEVKKLVIKTDHTGGAGGYSSGGTIVLKDKLDGVRKVSTLFHELTHELLHWDPAFKREDSTREEREIDAESTSYVVCRHYHIENELTASYLTGWMTSGSKTDMSPEAIQKSAIGKLEARRKNIRAASIEIFEGVDAMMALLSPEELTPQDKSIPEPVDFIPSNEPSVAVPSGVDKKASALPFFLSSYIGKLS